MGFKMAFKKESGKKLLPSPNSKIRGQKTLKKDDETDLLLDSMTSKIC